MSRARARRGPAPRAATCVALRCVVERQVELVGQRGEPGPTRAPLRCRIGWRGSASAAEVVVSDRSRKFVECSSDGQSREGINAEFVVTSSENLHERVDADDHAGGAVTLQSAHWSKPCLESTVVGFDLVVLVLGGVVVHGRQELDDGAGQRRGPIRGGTVALSVHVGRGEAVGMKGTVALSRTSRPRASEGPRVAA